MSAIQSASNLAATQAAIPATIPLALYVHLPWCIKKCPYCDFNSHEQKPDTDFAAYANAVLNDLRWEHEQDWRGRAIQSIFFGGGTPSLFPAEHVDQILRQAERLFGFASDIEITLEANPGAIDETRFQRLRQAGVNRLSIGVQSFNNDHLQALGRVHDSSQAARAFDAARDSGFENINLDLMFGLPGQSMTQSLSDLDTATRLAPEHISAYQLTLEPNTRFHKFPPALPDEDTLSDMQQNAVEKLAAHGYTRYEVSAYASAGKQCLHNKNYWLFGDYIGAGAGAHGKQTKRSGIVRRSKTKHPARYIKQWQHNGSDAEINQRELNQNDIAFEFMLNALRLTNGFTQECFEQNTGLSINIIEPKINRLLEQKLLSRQTGHIKTTEKGFLFLNEVLQTLLPDAAEDSTVSARVHPASIS